MKGIRKIQIRTAVIMLFLAVWHLILSIPGILTAPGAIMGIYSILLHVIEMVAVVAVIKMLSKIKTERGKEKSESTTSFGIFSVLFTKAGDTFNSFRTSSVDSTNQPRFRQNSSDNPSSSTSGLSSLIGMLRRTSSQADSSSQDPNSSSNVVVSSSSTNPKSSSTSHLESKVESSSHDVESSVHQEEEEKRRGPPGVTLEPQKSKFFPRLSGDNYESIHHDNVMRSMDQNDDDEEENEKEMEMNIISSTLRDEDLIFTPPSRNSNLLKTQSSKNAGNMIAPSFQESSIRSIMWYFMIYIMISWFHVIFSWFSLLHFIFSISLFLFVFYF